MEIEKSPQKSQPSQPPSSVSKNDWDEFKIKIDKNHLKMSVSYIAKVTVTIDNVEKEFYSSDDKSSFLPDHQTARNLASKFANSQIDWNSIQKQKAQSYGAPTNPKYEFDEICKLPKFSGIILEHETIMNKIQKSFHASGKLSGPKSSKFIDKNVIGNENSSLELFTVEFKTTKGYPDKASAERKVAQTLLRFASVYNDQVWEAYKKLTPEQQLFRIGEKVEFGEDEKIEFKGHHSSEPLKELSKSQIFEHITSQLLRTSAGFMNTKGGSLFIGINDDQKVPGCILTADDQDEIRLRCFNRLRNGLKTMDWTNHVNVTFHPVIATNRSDLFVVEVMVTKATQTQLTTVGEQYIRWGASTTVFTDTATAEPKFQSTSLIEMVKKISTENARLNSEHEKLNQELLTFLKNQNTIEKSKQEQSSPIPPSLQSPNLITTTTPTTSTLITSPTSVLPLTQPPNSNSTPTTPKLAPVDSYCENIPHMKLAQVHTEGNVNWTVVLNLTNIAKNYNAFEIIQLLSVNGSFYYYNRWGRVGEQGKENLGGPFDLATAKQSFSAKFKEKTGNEWNNGILNFSPIPGKYNLIEMVF